MSPLRILVAANVPDNRTGGATRMMAFPHDIIEAEGHHVEYFYAGAAARLGARGRWARFTFPLAIVRHLKSQLARGVRYDIVNVHEPSGVALLLMRKRLGAPAVVAMSHGLERRVWELGLEELRLGRTGPSHKTRLIYPITSLWQSSYTLRHADHVCCVSEEDRAYLLEWLGRPAETVTRVVSAAEAGFAQAALGRDYARSSRILFAGTWRKNKGIEDLVPAFAALASRHPEVRLTVLGGGVGQDTVRGCFPPVVRDRIRCVTAETEEETRTQFASHDLFILPSLFEGTPLTMMEALASGLPVVTTRTCGMPEVIPDGEAGLLVPMRDPGAIALALERLITSGELRRKLGRAGQALVLERYTWRATADALMRVYDSVTAAKKPGS